VAAAEADGPMEQLRALEREFQCASRQLCQQLLVWWQGHSRKAVAGNEQDQVLVQAAGRSTLWKMFSVPPGAFQACRQRRMVCLCRSNKPEGKGFGAAKAKLAKPPPSAVKQAPKADRRWQLEPYDVPEWLQWIAEQQEAAKVKAGEGLSLSMAEGLWAPAQPPLPAPCWSTVPGFPVFRNRLQ